MKCGKPRGRGEGSVRDAETKVVCLWKKEGGVLRPTILLNFLTPWKNPLLFFPSLTMFSTWKREKQKKCTKNLGLKVQKRIDWKKGDHHEDEKKEERHWEDKQTRVNCCGKKRDAQTLTQKTEKKRPLESSRIPMKQESTIRKEGVSKIEGCFLFKLLFTDSDILY